MTQRPVLVLGADFPTGCYVLRIRVARDLVQRFGRYDGGRSVPLPAGAYAYLGSAMGRGASGLVRRLLRHCHRSEGRPPQAIRGALLRGFIDAGLASSDEDPLPRGEKRLHWHVDHLLDRAEAEIDGVLILRSPQRLEPALARRLAEDPRSAPVAPGLGASDAPGATHLLRVPGGADWWADLVLACEHLASRQTG